MDWSSQVLLIRVMDGGCTYCQFSKISYGSLLTTPPGQQVWVVSPADRDFHRLESSLADRDFHLLHFQSDCFQIVMPKRHHGHAGESHLGKSKIILLGAFIEIGTFTGQGQ